MLVLSPERLIPLGSNDITLFKDGYYFYLDRATYDSCIILSSKFTNETIAQEIDSESNKEVVEFFEGFLPYPIGILAPFLALVETDVDMDLEECVKAIHIITNTISIQRFIGVPKEIRKTVSFSLSIGDEAELSTNAFLSSSMDYETIVNMMKGQYSAQPISYSQPTQMQAPTENFQPQQQSYNPVQSQPVAQVPPSAPGEFDRDSFDLDSAGLEELRAHPDYVETGPGVFYNLIDDTCAIVDVPEDDAFLERSAELDAMEKNAGAAEEEEVSNSTGSTVTEEEAQGLGNILL